MTELVFLKLGGSLITDKTKPYTVQTDKLAELAGEIQTALHDLPDLKIILGHGSGSFGHYAVKEHWSSYASEANQGEIRFWRGFAEVWYRASQLNRHVIEALRHAGLPCLAFPASASVSSENGKITSWDLAPLRAALQRNILPLIYGDVVFDAKLGGVVLSTEALMFHLAHELRPERILLAGLEAGVWSDFPARRQKVARLTPGSYSNLANQPGGSHGTDVTGGMKSKVEQMLELVRQLPEIKVEIFSGEVQGNIQKTLAGEHLGTLITCD